MPIREEEQRERLMREGFCVFENVLGAAEPPAWSNTAGAGLK